MSCRPLKKARRHDGPVLSESYSFCCCVDVVLSSTSCIRLLPRLIVPVVLFRFLFLYQCLSFRPGCFRRRKGLQDCRVINVRICKTAFSSIFWSHVEKFTDSENASYYPRRLRRSALVGFSSPSVCLSVCLIVCLSAAELKNEWSQSVQSWYREWPWVSYKWHGFGLKGQRSTLGLQLTAVRRGFELYECLLVLSYDDKIMTRM